MTPVARSKPEKHEPAGDAWALLQRVLASRQFEKSARLREFLSYVTERVLTEPGVRIHEQEIATRVFLRLSEGAKGEDTTVRVHAYQLRKRLDEYFATDGADESLIIEIPKGNYAPVFRFRENVPAG